MAKAQYIGQRELNLDLSASSIEKTKVHNHAIQELVNNQRLIWVFVAIATEFSIIPNSNYHQISNLPFHPTTHCNQATGFQDYPCQNIDFRRI